MTWSFFYSPPLRWYQLELRGSVPSEKASYQSAFPVLCVIWCSLFEAAPLCKGVILSFHIGKLFISPCIIFCNGRVWKKCWSLVTWRRQLRCRRIEWRRRRRLKRRRVGLVRRQRRHPGKTHLKWNKKRWLIKKCVTFPNAKRAKRAKWANQANGPNGPKELNGPNRPNSYYMDPDLSCPLITFLLRKSDGNLHLWHSDLVIF